MAIVTFWAAYMGVQKIFSHFFPDNEDNTNENKRLLSIIGILLYLKQ